MRARRVGVYGFGKWRLVEPQFLAEAVDTAAFGASAPEVVVWGVGGGGRWLLLPAAERRG